jgi:hypothetical protein
VGVLKNIPVGVPKIRKIKKVTTSQDDDFVGVLKKSIPNKLALMDTSPGLDLKGRPRDGVNEPRRSHPSAVPAGLNHVS